MGGGSAENHGKGGGGFRRKASTEACKMSVQRTNSYVLLRGVSLVLGKLFSGSNRIWRKRTGVEEQVLNTGVTFASMWLAGVHTSTVPPFPLMIPEREMRFVWLTVLPFFMSASITFSSAPTSHLPLSVLSPSAGWRMLSFSFGRSRHIPCEPG